MSKFTSDAFQACYIFTWLVVCINTVQYAAYISSDSPIFLGQIMQRPTHYKL